MALTHTPAPEFGALAPDFSLKATDGKTYALKDIQGELQYRSRLDAGNPSKPATGETKKELVDAMLRIASTGKGPEKQTPSMGCNIKWKNTRAA